MPIQTLAPQPVDPCAELLLNDTRLSRLAMELARDVYPTEQIYALYNITREQFVEYIVDNPVFMTYFAEAREVWGSSAAAGQRVALKAGVIFENWIDEADKYLHDPNSPLKDKIELGKYMSRLAGFENVHGTAAQDASRAGATATVVINLSHGKKIEIQKQYIPGDDARIVNGPDGDPMPIHTLPAQVTIAPGEEKFGASRGQVVNGNINTGPAGVPR